MLLGQAIAVDIAAARKMKLGKRGLFLLFFASLAACGLLSSVGKMEVALPLLCGAIALGFAIAVKWRLRRRVWFWLVAAMVAAAQVWMVFLIPWTDRWVPAVVTIPIATGDLIGIIAILSVLECFFDGPEAAATVAAEAAIHRRSPRRRRPRA